jgi:hypothetical protein
LGKAKKRKILNAFTVQFDSFYTGSNGPCDLPASDSRTRAGKLLGSRHTILPKTHVILSDAALVSALSSFLPDARDQRVKLLRVGCPACFVTLAMAVAIAKAGSYQGKIRKNRAYYIREIPRPCCARDDAYWRDRAVLRYWAGQRYRDDPYDVVRFWQRSLGTGTQAAGAGTQAAPTSP